MKNKYERQIPIDYWLIQQKDLERIYKFIESRIKQSKIDDKETSTSINIEFQSGDTITYESVEELKNDAERLKDLLHQGEVVKALNIGSSAHNYKRCLFIHIWLAITFDKYFASHHINIIASDGDGSLRDSVLGCVDGAESMFALFTVKDEILRVLKSRFPKDQERIIIFDVYGENLKSITNELAIAERKAMDQKETQRSLTIGQKLSRFLREHWIPALAIFLFTIAGSIAAIVALF